MNYLPVLIFTVIYLLLCNWFQIKSFVFVLIRPKERVRFVYDAWISKTLLKKTGVKIDTITIFESKSLFGMMPSTPPFQTNMILSRGMYESFNKDELEWVILHEAGHYVLWHGAKLACVQVLSLLFGAYFVAISGSLIIDVILVLLLTFLSIQFSKYIEYEADKYSIAQVDNPQGVITAQAKLITSYNINENNFYTKYLRGATLPSQRIALARERME